MPPRACGVGAGTGRPHCRFASLHRGVCSEAPGPSVCQSWGPAHEGHRHRPPPRAPPGSWRVRGWSGRGRRDLSPRPREVKPRAPRPAVGGRAGAGPEAAVVERHPLPAVRRPREHRRGSRCGGQHGGWCICVRGPGGQPASPPAEPSGTACHRPPCATQPGSPGSPRRPPTPESVSLERFLCLRQPRSTVRLADGLVSAFPERFPLRQRPRRDDGASSRGRPPSSREGSLRSQNAPLGAWTGPSRPVCSPTPSAHLPPRLQPPARVRPVLRAPLPRCKAIVFPLVSF